MRRTCSRLILALLGLSIVAALRPLTAQQPPVLGPGQLVQVTASSVGWDRTEGTVVAVRGRDLVLAVEHVRPGQGRFAVLTDTVNVTVSLDAVGGLWVPSGTRSHAGAGAVIGGVLGAAVGALAYSPSPQQPLTPCSVNPFCGLQQIGRDVDVAGARLLWGWLGALSGALLGASIGSQVRTRAWAPVPPDDLARVRATVAPLPAGRLGLGAAVSF